MPTGKSVGLCGLSSSFPPSFRMWLLPLPIILTIQLACPNGHLFFVLSFQHTSHLLLVTAHHFPEGICPFPIHGGSLGATSRNTYSQAQQSQVANHSTPIPWPQGLAQGIPTLSQSASACRNLTSEQTSQDRRKLELGLTTVIWRKAMKYSKPSCLLPALHPLLLSCSELSPYLSNKLNWYLSESESFCCKQ